MEAKLTMVAVWVGGRRRCVWVLGSFSLYCWESSVLLYITNPPTVPMERDPRAWCLDDDVLSSLTAGFRWLGQLVTPQGRS